MVIIWQPLSFTVAQESWNLAQLRYIYFALSPVSVGLEPFSNITEVLDRQYWVLGSCHNDKENKHDIDSSFGLRRYANG